MTEEPESNIVSLFWWKYKRAEVPPPPPPRTTDQKIDDAFRKQRQRLGED